MPHTLYFKPLPENSHLDRILVREVNAVIRGDLSSLDAPEVKILYDANDELAKLDLKTEENKAKVADVFNFVCTHPQVSTTGIVLFCRMLLNHELYLLFEDFPEYKEFVRQYSNLLSTSSSFKEEQ